MLERTSDIYLKPGTRREKLNSTVSSESRVAALQLNSKIVNDIAAIQRLFDNKIASFKLIFRASENGFSIKEFHKKCDGQGGTLILAET